jgi:type IV pilus assembly protein PilY1
MANPRSLPPLRRWTAALLAVLTGFGPLLTPAYAAGLIPLANEPIGIQNNAPPNIILTVDDSTSMLSDWLPEAVARDDYTVNTNCRDGVGAMKSICGNPGSANDFGAFGGPTDKFFSPGFTSQQFGYPYPKTSGNTGVAPGVPYDASGPGAGCHAGSAGPPATQPNCYHGVDPVNLPGGLTQPSGIGNFPVPDANDPTSPPVGWPLAGQPYPYWQLWPAPVHNAAVNALYYNPELTYDPPLDSTGASFPPMNAGNTATWTQVPSDPWAATIVFVDLTAPVTVGLWCNSDWSMGAQNDPTQCRRNGTAAAAVGTGLAPEGQDYTYPWAPPGFTPSASTGDRFVPVTVSTPLARVPSTTLTYAAQKVSLDPVSLAALPVPTNNNLFTTALWATPQGANATSQDPKYFYENENILWCDPTSPAWPQTGPTETQLCTNLVFQTCVGAITGTCGGVNPPTCNGFVQASCNGGAAPNCVGYMPQQCVGVAGAQCNGFVPAACNNVQPPKCNTGPQTCNGTPQACNFTGQTCSGPLSQTCSLPPQTCQPPVCTTVYTPPGCNLLPPDPENPCTTTQQCAPPVCTQPPGSCSITGASCTIQGVDPGECPNQPGVCSVDHKSCMSAGACAQIGHCSSDGLSCTQANGSDCAIQGGTCNLTGAACNGTTNPCVAAGTCQTPAGTQCTAATQNTVCQSTPGTCTNPVGQACTVATQCTATPGVCVTPVGQACTSAGQCTGTPNSGHCTVGGAACTVDTDCPSQNGTCVTPAGQTCTMASNCSQTPGICNTSGLACNPGPVCSSTPGTCVTPVGQSCNGAGACSPTPGTCNNPAGLSCTVSSTCTSVAGNCSVQTTQSCPANGTDYAHCPILGTCSITGAQCIYFNGTTFNFFCPSLPGPLSPSAASCSTGGVGGVATADLRQDAENNGVVCRRNNKDYPALAASPGIGAVAPVSAGPYNYPNNYGTAGNNYTTPITGGTGADACMATPHFVSVPRHYWNTSVEWCDTQIGLVGDKWLGYGTDVNGTCHVGFDAAHIYPRFFQFGASGFVDNYANAAFQRVDLDITQRATASYTTTWTDANSQQQTITRTFDEEMTNYANWFAYYRTRVQAVKTVTSIVFTQLDNTFNVGFQTLSNGLTTTTAQSDPATFVNIAPFDAGQKATWYQQLFAITIPLRLATPTLGAITRIGEYFLNGTSPELAGSTDPITLSCQKNWHILFTDGFQNQSGLPATTVGNQDLTVPIYPDCCGNPGNNPIAGMVPGQPWPHPYQEDPNAGASNSQSDYAMNYWVTDLRTGVGNPTAPNNVPTSSTDPADWQHLNFAALALGTHGKLNAANPSLTLNQLAAGAQQWPQPIPTVFHPDNSGVDDLWHAAVNGRGQFVNANSAAQLQLGMGQILQGIANQEGSRAAAGFSSNTISPTNNSIYEVNFQPGWGGDVIKVLVDPVTGLHGAPVWDAAKQLGSQLLIVNPGDTPWFTNRKIFTVNDANQAVPFLWGNLSAAQRDSLAPGLPATGQQILAYLRGNPIDEGISLGQFRVRATVASGEDFLGDIVNSSAVYVGPPNASYLEGNDPGYAAFAAGHVLRTPMVYVGANDGMLHAIDDTTGNEAWAFVPHALYRPNATGLGALSYQDGALPPFRHHYYVDSTPRVIDVDFGNQNWHSLLVGGLGKGGRTYYALDVTDPASVTTELTAADQYLWTFTDPDMGFTYMQPIVAKTRAFNGAWLVIVTSGYNNPSGVGKIFFINAADGTLLKTMSTGFGDSADPSGFAQIAGFTKDFHNQLVEQLYGGDLYGNFWRFDVSDPNPGNWTVVLMASLTDPSGTPQPVTTTPNIEVDAINGIDRWVFVGTGRLLDPSDLTNPSIANQINTLYAIRDGTGITPSVFGAPLQPRVSMVKLVDRLNGLGGKPQFGWYDDLGVGQRIVTPPQAAISLVAYAGTRPQTDPCLTGQPATLYVRDFSFGASLFKNLGGDPSTGGIDENSGAVGMGIFSFPGSSSSASSGTLDIRIGVTAGTTGDVTFFKVKLNFPFAAHRMSWRLLGQ